MGTYRVTDTSTGKQTEIYWGGEAPPSQDDVDRILGNKVVVDQPQESGWLEGMAKVAAQVPYAFGKAGAGIVQAVEEASPRSITIPGAASELGLMAARGFGRITGSEVIQENVRKAEELRDSLTPDFLKAPVIATAEKGVGMSKTLGEQGAKYFDEKLEGLEPKAPAGSAKAQVFGAMKSVALNIPFIIAGALTRNPRIALMGMATEQGGEQYATMRAAGQSPEQSLAGAMGYGAAEYWTEKIPIGVLLNKNVPLGKKILKEMLTDIPGELAATTIESGLIDTATTNPDKTLGEFIQDLKNTAIQTAIASPVMVGVTHPMVKWAEKQEARMIRDNVVNQDYLKMDDTTFSQYFTYAAELSKNRPEIKPQVEELKKHLGWRQANPQIRSEVQEAIDLTNEIYAEEGMTQMNPRVNQEVQIAQSYNQSQSRAMADDVVVHKEIEPTASLLTKISEVGNGQEVSSKTEEARVKAEAESLGLVYGGKWEPPGQQPLYTFRDPMNGGNFEIRSGDNLGEKLASHRDKGWLQSVTPGPDTRTVIHYARTPRNELRGSEVSDETNTYSRNIRQEMEQGDVHPEWPYVPRVNTYDAGVVIREKRVLSSRTPHQIEVPISKIYNFNTDPKGFRSQAQQIMEQSGDTPNGSWGMNIFSTLAKRSGYVGYEVTSADDKAERMTFLFGKWKAQPSTHINANLSGQVQGVMTPAVTFNSAKIQGEQDIPVILSTIQNTLNSIFPEVVIATSPIRNYYSGGWTDVGEIEPSVSIGLKGPPLSIEAALTYTGLSLNQNAIMLYHTVSEANSEESTGYFYSFNIKPGQEQALIDAAHARGLKDIQLSEVGNGHALNVYVSHKQIDQLQGGIKTLLQDFGQGELQTDLAVVQFVEKGEGAQKVLNRFFGEREGGIRYAEAEESGRRYTEEKSQRTQGTSGLGQGEGDRGVTSQGTVNGNIQSSEGVDTRGSGVTPTSSNLLTQSNSYFSLNYPSQPIYSPAQVDLFIRPIINKFPNFGNVVVMNSAMDLPIDAVTRSGQTIEQGDQVFALYDHQTGTTYINAEAVASPEAAMTILLHEGVGHRGINLLLDVMSDKTRGMIYNMVNKAYGESDLGKEIIKNYKLTRITNSPTQQMTFAKELIAHMAQTGEKPTLFHRIAAYIRQALRNIGFTITFSDTDIKGLIAKSYQQLNEGATTGTGESSLSTRGVAPTWYSKMAQVFGQKLPGSGTPEQLVQTIQSWANKGEFKSEELKWSGLLTWLKEKNGKVSKQEILDFVASNQIDVREITKEVDESKFAQYTLPGGINYRELLFTFEQKDTSLNQDARKQYGKDFTDLTTEELRNLKVEKDKYQSSHWNELNVLAHVRFNERTDADGNRVLFIEEVQSDWHQEGKKKGYRQPGEKSTTPYGWGSTGQASSGAPPEAPFSKTWHEFVMKRMLRYAAENGFDKVAWTTGEQQAERYDLSKQIDELKVGHNADGYFIQATAKDTNEFISHAGLTAKSLENTIGKDIANKAIIDLEGKEDGYHTTYSGLDLKVGGQGMAGFYDKMLPDFMNKYGKQWGVKVGETNIIIDEGYTDVKPGPYKDYLESHPTTVHSFSVTPSMKESVLFTGQPMFMRGMTAEPVPDYSQFMSDNWEAAKAQLRAWKPTNLPHAGVVERMLKTPMNIDHPIFQKIVHVFQDLRQEWFHSIGTNIIGEGDNNALDAITKFQKTDKEGYAKLNEVRAAIDRYYVPSPEERKNYNLLMSNLTQKVKDAGVSEEGIRVWQLERAMLDRALQAYMGDMEQQLEKLENDPTIIEDVFGFNERSTDKTGKWDIEKSYNFDKASYYTVGESKADQYGLPSTPGVTYIMGQRLNGGFGVRQIHFDKSKMDETQAEQWWEANKLQFSKANYDSRADLRNTIRGNITLMGQYRGTYAPRVRLPGKYAVRGYKTNEDGGRVFYRQHVNSTYQANNLMSQLKRDGWKEVDYAEVNKLPEAVYQDLKADALQKAIDRTMNAVEKKGSLTPEFSQMVRQELLGAGADIFKERGYLQSRMQRNKNVLVEGYITDMLESNIRYVSNLAGGLSKAQVARDAMEYLSQIPATGKNAQVHQYARNYMVENLRNMDHVDRIMGMLKTVASMKYLTSIIRTPIVNLTSLLTTAGPAIHQYSGDGQVSMTKVQSTLGKSIKDYINHMLNKKMTNDVDEKFVQEVTKMHFDDPQFMRDAVAMMQSRSQGYVQQALKWGFMGMTLTEQINRGSTLLAGFRIAYEQNLKSGMDENAAYLDAFDRAIESTKQAHAKYGVSNKPEVTWGTGVGARVGTALYTYTNFSHQYLQLLYNLLVKKGNIKSFLWASLSPLVLGGAAALPFKDDILNMAGALLKLLGYKDDPEKWVWDQMRKGFGPMGEQFGRFGLTGLAGFDISGSLAIGISMPQKLTDWMGPMGGVLDDVREAINYMSLGHYDRAAEMALPRVGADIMRAYRESKEGITTREHRPVFGDDNRQLRPDFGESLARSLGFRSSRTAVASMRTSEAKRELAAFTETRNDIYERYRAYLLGGKSDPKEMAIIMRKIHEFNLKASTVPGIALIRMSSLRTQARSTMKPSKQMRLLTGA